MIIINISEWILNFFIFSLAILWSSIGLFIFSLCVYAFKELILIIIKYTKGD